MRTFVLLISLATTTAAAATLTAQSTPPRRERASAAVRLQPMIHYRLRVDSADLGAMHVEIRLRNLPDTFRLAMAAHPEYDDRYWRYVDGPRVEGHGGSASVVREDSALWRVVAPSGGGGGGGGGGGEVTVRYAVRLPAPPVGSGGGGGGPALRGSWRPFLAPTGGLVGGPHAFMYVVGETRAPSHVTFELPNGWEVATGLTPTADPRTFHAADAEALVESPALVGRLRSWRFAVDGVPHRVVYWPRPDAAPFDTAAFVGNVERLAREAVATFGYAPYRDFTFLFQDGAYGGLEHPTSVSLGAPSASLASDPASSLEETAHEYAHTWNLVALKPIERGDPSWRKARPTPVLWWSEGATMYYADLLLRRAGLPVEDSTRLAHLESLLRRYYGNPGNTHVSPERASLVTNGEPPGALGDYDPSVHLQGELLSAMLDLVVRDATANRRSLDDVMRALLARHAGDGKPGITTRDVERAVAEQCACDVRGFFDAHVRGARPLDVDRYLALAGLRARVSRGVSLDREGHARPDLRLWGWLPEGERSLRLVINDPSSAWGRAGLHTGDRIVTLNDSAVADWPALRRFMTGRHVGDTVRFSVERGGRPLQTRVVVTTLEEPVVRVEEIAGATERQRATRAAWLKGAR